MSKPSDQSNEERALDALLAAAFRSKALDEPVTEEDARRLVDKPPAVSPEDEQTLASMGPDFVKTLLTAAGHDAATQEKRVRTRDRSIEQAYAGMNRAREGEELDEEARKEIERKRRELLGESEREDKPDQEEQHGS